MRIEDLRETAQAKIGTRRLEEQPGSRGDVGLASQAHPEADYSRPGGYNSRFPVSISGSADDGSGVNIQPTGFLAKIKTTKKDARFGTFRISGGKV